MTIGLGSNIPIASSHGNSTKGNWHALAHIWSVSSGMWVGRPFFEDTTSHKRYAHFRVIRYEVKGCAVERLVSVRCFTVRSTTEILSKKIVSEKQTTMDHDILNTGYAIEFTLQSFARRHKWRCRRGWPFRFRFSRIPFCSVATFSIEHQYGMTLIMNNASCRLCSALVAVPLKANWLNFLFQLHKYMDVVARSPVGIIYC
jgi:hypothetical protein